MHINNRRKIGLLLIGASVLTAVAVQLVTGAVFEARTVREDKLQSGPDFGMVASEISLKINPRYAIPLAACGLVGVVCLVWPTRKPPRLVA